MDARREDAWLEPGLTPEPNLKKHDTLRLPERAVVREAILQPSSFSCTLQTYSMKEVYWVL